MQFLQTKPAALPDRIARGIGSAIVKPPFLD